MIHNLVAPITAFTRRSLRLTAAAALLAGSLAQPAHAAQAADVARAAAAADRQPLAESRVVGVSSLSFGRQVLAAQMPVLVDFSASWCAPCKAMDRSLDEVAATAGGRVRVVRVNVGVWSRGLAARYGVEALPTVLLFDHGVVIDRETGVLGTGDLRDMVANGVHLELAAAPAAAGVAAAAAPGATR
jgi:thioredoxin 1